MDINQEVFSHKSSNGMRVMMTAFAALNLLLIVFAIAGTGLVGTFKFTDESPIGALILTLMFTFGLLYMGFQLPWQRRLLIRSNGMVTISSLYLNGWTSWSMSKEQVVCSFTTTGEIDHLGLIVRDSAGTITAIELGSDYSSEKQKMTAAEINKVLGLPQGDVLHIESEFPDLGHPWSPEKILFSFSYLRFRRFIASRRG
jgi:hypothetical protein